MWCETHVFENQHAIRSMCLSVEEVDRQLLCRCIDSVVLVYCKLAGDF